MFDKEEEYRALKEMMRKLDEAVASAEDGASIDPGFTRDEWVRFSAMLGGSDKFDPELRDSLLAIVNKATSH